MSGGTAQRPRLLVLAPRAPWPLDSGGALRLHHQLRGLAQAAEVTLAVREAPQAAARVPAGMRVECVGPGRVSAVAGGAAPAAISWQAAGACERHRRVPPALTLARRHFGYDQELAGWLHRHACSERFDVALFSGAALGVYVTASAVPVVWDAVDELVLYTVRAAQARTWRAWPGALRRGLLYALYQRRAAAHAFATVFASRIDAACASRWVNGARLAVVTNGVDGDYFRPSREPPEPHTLVFVGALDFPPNSDGIVHFATRVWPALYGRDQRRRLWVVGRDPVAQVRALAARPGVELFPDVPDVRPFLARAAVVVVPTRGGGGVKNKVLEACAMRRPVVATPRAVAGLTLRPGQDVLVADSPAAWLDRVERLLAQPELAARTARNGYRWVRANHSWPAAAAQLWAILTAAARSRRRRPAPAPLRPVRCLEDAPWR